MDIFVTAIRPILIEPSNDLLRRELAVGARVVQVVAFAGLLMSSYGLVSNLYQICAGSLIGKLLGVAYGASSVASLAISHDVFQIATNAYTLSESSSRRVTAAASASQFAKIMLQNTVLGPLKIQRLVQVLTLST